MGCISAPPVSDRSRNSILGFLHARPRSLFVIAAVSAASPTVAGADETGAAATPPSSDMASDKVESGREVGVFPLVGGDTDNGFGAGAIGSIASFDPKNPIYRWKLDFSAFVATKSPPSPSYIDLATTLTLPQLLDDHLRLEMRPSFTLDSALPFYGIGNKPSVPSTTQADRDFYKRVHPAVSMNARWRLSDHWFALDGIQATYNKITSASASTLERDLGATDPFLTKSHGVLRLETGLAYDTRDNELAPNSGQWHQVKIRVSPRLGDALPYQYEQYDAIVRYYRTLVPNKLVLALRAVGDVQAGNVPFYEESRYEETSAIGGTQGVRGVPAYSFYGHVKAFGNVELRAKVWRFEAVSRKFIVGFAGFFDAGRVWTDIRAAHPDQDGTGLGIHYGVGGGIRVQQGRSFLVRADLAWSPDARPIGAYVMADQAF